MSLTVIMVCCTRKLVFCSFISAYMSRHDSWTDNIRKCKLTRWKLLSNGKFEEWSILQFIFSMLSGLYRVCILACPWKSHVRRRAKWKPHLIGLQRFAFHVKVPHLNRQIIPGHQVASAVAELDIRDGWDDFRKERPVAWILGLFKDWIKAGEISLSATLTEWTFFSESNHNPSLPPSVVRNAIHALWSGLCGVSLSLSPSLSSISPWQIKATRRVLTDRCRSTKHWPLGLAWIECMCPRQTLCHLSFHKSSEVQVKLHIVH